MKVYRKKVEPGWDWNHPRQSWTKVFLKLRKYLLKSPATVFWLFMKRFWYHHQKFDCFYGKVYKIIIIILCILIIVINILYCFKYIISKSLPELFLPPKPCCLLHQCRCLLKFFILEKFCLLNFFHSWEISSPKVFYSSEILSPMFFILHKI